MRARLGRQVLFASLAPLATLALATTGTGSATTAVSADAPAGGGGDRVVSVGSSPVTTRQAAGNGGSISGTAQAAMLRSSQVADIPDGALAAYQRAAQVIDGARPDCHLSWTLLAAVGRIESDHGQKAQGGKVLGKLLDGKHATRVVRDTDAGRLDGSKVYDRAVGPMQLLPATWQVVAVDADGNGTRDPQDVDDAALGAAVFLCGGDEDLATGSGQLTALKRYDSSPSFAPLAVRLAKAYAASATPSQLLPAFDATTTVDLPDTVQADMPHGTGLGKHEPAKPAKSAKASRTVIHPAPSSPTPTGDGGSAGSGTPSAPSTGGGSTTPSSPSSPASPSSPSSPANPPSGGPTGGPSNPPPAPPTPSDDAEQYCTTNGYGPDTTPDSYDPDAAEGTFDWCEAQYDDGTQVTPKPTATATATP